MCVLAGTVVTIHVYYQKVSHPSGSLTRRYSHIDRYCFDQPTQSGSRQTSPCRNLYGKRFRNVNRLCAQQFTGIDECCVIAPKCRNKFRRMKPTRPHTSRYKNRLLAALPRTEINRLARDLEQVTLRQGQVLLDGKAPYAYFLEEGMASVVISLASGDTIEVGVIGREGAVGLPILFGTGSVPGRTFMQIAGTGHRVKAELMKDALDRGGELRQLLFRHAHGLFVQGAQTAACNRLHTIEERLARWLLTCHDRMDADLLHLTHDFLAQMLGSPRTTVTLAAGTLQRSGLIDYSRGKVTIQNRSGLEKIACECYRTVRDEYRRLGLSTPR